MKTVGILFPLRPSRGPTPPSANAFGRAATALAQEGIDVIIGSETRDGHLSGQAVRAGAWVEVHDVAIDAWYHRFPDGDKPTEWAQVLAGCADRPVVNHPDVVALCRDKLACQHFLTSLGLPMPEVVGDTMQFHDALARWGQAFLKPRFGAFGVGIQRITNLDAPLQDGRWILQRAISPPPSWAGISIRVLVQRDGTGEWIQYPGAARVSQDDPVVNHARGARVCPASSVLTEASHNTLKAQTQRVCDAFSSHPQGGSVIELGLDFVVGRGGEPHLIEVNAKPRGRLSALSALDHETYGALAAEAVLNPLRAALWCAAP